MSRFIFAIAILCMLFLSVNAFAQWETTSSNSDAKNAQAFGIHFGYVSGNGYAYRYMTDKWGLQLVGGGYSLGSNSHDFSDQVYSDDNTLSSLIRTDKGRKYSFDLAANVIIPLQRTSNTLFYVHGGFCWKYSVQKVYEQSYIQSAANSHTYNETGPTSSTSKIRSYTNLGAGPGAEFQLGKFFKLVLELPITYTGNDEFIMYIPQAGLYYYFK